MEVVIEFTAVILGFLAGMVLVSSVEDRGGSALRFATPFIWLALGFLIVQLV